MEKLVQLLLALPDDLKSKLTNDTLVKQHIVLILAEINNLFIKIQQEWRRVSKTTDNSDTAITIVIRQLLPNDKQQLTTLIAKLNQLGEVMRETSKPTPQLETLNHIAHLKQAEENNELDLNQMQKQALLSDQKRQLIANYLNVTKAIARADFLFHAAPAQLEEVSYQDILSRTSYADGTIDLLKKERIDFWLSILETLLIKQDLERSEAIIKALSRHQIDQQLTNQQVSGNQQHIAADTLHKYQALKSRFMKIHTTEEARKERELKQANEQKEKKAKSSGNINRLLAERMAKSKDNESEWWNKLQRPKSRSVTTQPLTHQTTAAQDDKKPNVKHNAPEKEAPFQKTSKLLPEKRVKRGFKNPLKDIPEEAQAATPTDPAVAWIRECVTTLEKTYKEQGLVKRFRAFVFLDNLTERMDHANTAQEQLRIIENAFKQYTIKHLRELMRDEESIFDKKFNPDQTQYGMYTSHLNYSDPKDHTYAKMLGALLKTIYAHLPETDNLKFNRELMSGIKSLNTSTITQGLKKILPPQTISRSSIEDICKRLKATKVLLSRDITEEQTSENNRLTLCQRAIFNAIYKLASAHTTTANALFATTTPLVTAITDANTLLIYAKSLLNPDKHREIIQSLNQEITGLSERLGQAHQVEEKYHVVSPRSGG